MKLQSMDAIIGKGGLFLFNFASDLKSYYKKIGILIYFYYFYVKNYLLINEKLYFFLSFFLSFYLLLFGEDSNSSTSFSTILL